MTEKASPKRALRIRRVLGVLAATYLIWFALITVLGLRTDLTRVDCIIIPGARVHANGEPGDSLTGRLDRALELYREGYSERLLCTGGLGRSGVIEAEAARDYLTERGVPTSSILLEGRSHTTWENLWYAREEMEQNNLNSCLVVTDPFHTQRAIWMARELGLEARPAPSFTGPGWATWPGFIGYTTREMVAWVKYGLERASRTIRGRKP